MSKVLKLSNVIKLSNVESRRIDKRRRDDRRIDDRRIDNTLKKIRANSSNSWQKITKSTLHDFVLLNLFQHLNKIESEINSD